VGTSSYLDAAPADARLEVGSTAYTPVGDRANRRHLRGDAAPLPAAGDGTVRDTVLFSVVAEDWPRVRDGLRARLG
jgi:hypothetical protein